MEKNAESKVRHKKELRRAKVCGVRKFLSTVAIENLENIGKRIIVLFLILR